MAKCIEAPTSLEFAVLHGVSQHRKSWLALGATKQLVSSLCPPKGRCLP
jgi:hypothetical protein